MGRLGSRIRTVAPAFPAQGPANVAGMLVGAVVTPRRFGRNPVLQLRGAATATSLADIPERAMVIKAPGELPAAAPAGLPSTDDCAGCG